MGDGVVLEEMCYWRHALAPMLFFYSLCRDLCLPYLSSLGHI